MPVNPQREKDDDLVKVEAFARNKVIQGAEKCDEFPVLVRITGVPWRRVEEMPRAGIDIVVVLNVRMDDAKEAMMMLVHRLNPNDRLSIVFVGFCMQHVMELTYMSNHGRDVARLKIRELAQSHVHHYTEYAAPALPRAAQILRQRGVEESSGRSGCILHMWAYRMDTEIHKQDISQEFPVHSIALRSHRPRDMKHVADMTSGTYSFVKGRDLDNIKYAMALFIARITSVAARSVTITLQADESVTISSIASGRYSNFVSSDKRSGTIDMSNICAGEQKNFIVYLTVPQDKEKLLTVSGGYQSLNTSKELVGLDVVVARPRRKCLPHEVIIHPKVAAELLRIRLMNGILDRNGYSTKLLWDQIKDSDEGRNAQAETLSELDKDVNGMRYGDDMQLSWLNCHEWQRATTKGTPTMSGAFQILQQHAHVHTSLVTIKGFTRNNAIMGSETCHKLPVLVRVTAAPWRHTAEMPRNGVDVVVVLDISRNMQMERLERVKQAMMIVIDKLGSDDRLSLVLLQTHRCRHMELTYMSDNHGHGQDTARFKISQLKASNGSYMGHIASAALREGAQVLQGRGAEECSRRLGCMVFLSGGDYPEILQTHISPEFPVHTFGLGADHNSKMMKYIADMTSGTYSFVNQESSNIRDALALFITGLTSIVATSITITLRAHFGIAISSIESGDYTHHVKSDDKMAGKIVVDHMYAGERKHFIVNLIVGSSEKELMTIGGQYKSFNGSKLLHEIDISMLRPWLTRKTRDLAIHPDVAAELTRISLRKGVLDMLEKQHLTGQELQYLWNTVKHPDVSMELAEKNRDILVMPYTLSWLSCHKWQRATTKGAANDSSDFRTIGQYANDDTNLVKIETFTRSNVIPSEDPCNKFSVLVRVAVAPWRSAEEMPHAGVDIVAVLDVSGRMQGKKLDHMKQAMMIVIDKLGANDRLSIVSFNTYENRLMKLTYMSNHDRQVPRLKINKLVASGQSDMGAALREGAQILWWRGAECSHRIGCMMLLSDGEYPDIFQTELNPEFPVHTFGLGTDHNPNVMKYIADMTSGTYSFINQDIDRIKDALALFIKGLTSVAAMSIKITLRTSEGITISSIESGGYINQVKSDDQSGTIDIYHICAGERKDFIVYLRVAESKKELMTIGGRYLSHDTVKHLAYMDVYVQRPHLECLPADLAIQPDVAAELMRIRLKKSLSAMLEKSPSNTELQQLWDEITDSDEGRGAPTETLSGLSMDVTEMKRGIEHPEEYYKSGLPYTLAWLSSHNWQRATIKGTSCSSRTIQTTGQDAEERTTLSRQPK